MNCQDARTLLAGYMDDALQPSDKAMIDEHVRGCAVCQSELAVMWKAQTQIARLMHTHLDKLNAPPDAWEGLQARLAGREMPPAEAPAPASVPVRRSAPPREADTTGEPITMRVKPSYAIRAFSFAFLALIAIAFVRLVIMPSLLPEAGVLGQPGTAEPEVSTGEATLIPTPEGSGIMAVTPTAEPTGDAGRFVPMLMPEGLPHSEAQPDPVTGGTRYAYFDSGTFLILSQRLDTAQEPPAGGVPISSFPGFVQPGLSGTETFENGATTINYTDGMRLTWFVGDTRLEIVTNLQAGNVYQFAGAVVRSIPHYAPTYQPAGFYAAKGTMAADFGLMISEDRYYGNDQFIVLTQQDTRLFDGMPEGEPVSINGIDGAALTGRAGTVSLNDGTSFQDQKYRLVLGMDGGGGGGGGSGNDPDPQLHPATLSYSDGLEIVWIAGEVRFSMLTNVPLEEAIRFAESLDVVWTPEFQPSTQADLTDLPQGRGLAFTVPEPNGLPEDFYGSAELTVYDEARGIIIEKRYYGNERFFILTAEQDNPAIPVDFTDLGGEPVTINGAEGLMVTGGAGTAGIDIATYTNLQDGVERVPLGAGGGGGGVIGFDPLWPKEIAYTDGTFLAWIADGVRLTMLTNLPQDEALAVAENLILFPQYMFFHPTNFGAMHVPAVSFTPLVPSYLPDGFNGFSGPTEVPGTEVYDTLTLLYLPGQTDDPRFYQFTQHPAFSEETLPDGERVFVNGVEAAVEQGISGTLPVDIYLYGLSAQDYTDAIRVTLIRDGVRVEVLAVDTLENVLNVAGGLTLAE